jgi:hypothetical protein
MIVLEFPEDVEVFLFLHDSSSTTFRREEFLLFGKRNSLRKFFTSRNIFLESKSLVPAESFAFLWEEGGD